MRALMALLLLSASASAASADEVDDFVNAQMARAHIPAVAVAVVRDGRVIRRQDYGQANLEWSAAANPDTAFQIASATKIFTGVALMRLVEAGRIDLDAPISTFFDGAPSAWSAVTVRHLATHSSGLPDDLGSPRPVGVQAVVKAAMARPLAYEPGTQARYGFTDFVVLRAILEKASGKPIDQLFKDEIVTPLALRNTRFAFTRDEPGQPIRSADIVPSRASVYAWRDGGQRVSEFLYGETGYGAGGLYSTADDLARLFAALDNGGYLKPESVKALQTPPVLADGKPSGFGVGWTARTYHRLPVSGHSGGPALADILRFEDQKLTVIALTNQQRYYPLLAERIADAYLPAFQPKAPMKDDAPALTARMLAVLADARETRADPSVFSETGQKNAAPFLADFGQALLVALGPARSAALTSDALEVGARIRTYRIAFAERDMTWRLKVDAHGRIDELRPDADRD